MSSRRGTEEERMKEQFFILYILAAIIDDVA
jgi:hypothetical protein